MPIKNFVLATTCRFFIISHVAVIFYSTKKELKINNCVRLPTDAISVHNLQKTWLVL